MNGLFVWFLKGFATVAIALLAILCFRYITDIVENSNDLAVVGGAMTVVVLLGAVVGAMKLLWWPQQEDQPWPPTEDPPKK